MEWLEASLAFIITMMMLSTIASMVVETLHRCLRMRERGLEQTLDALFEKVIWPKVARAKDTLGDGTIKNLWHRNFVTTMTGNEFPKARERPEHWYLVWHWLKWVVAVGVGKLTNARRQLGHHRRDRRQRSGFQSRTFIQTRSGETVRYARGTVDIPSDYGGW